MLWIDLQMQDSSFVMIKYQILCICLSRIAHMPIYMIQMQAQSKDDKRTQSQKSRVRVAIRVRPLIEREKGDRTCIDCRSDQQLIIGGQRSYKFDNVFDASSPQPTVYEQCVRDLVLSCFQGYNAAILAYGQTGSGKTFTMGTATSDFSDLSSVGIIPRVVSQIFEQSKEKKGLQIKASFIQIYNEQIIDLLADSHLRDIKNRDNSISIRQEKDGSVTLSGAVQEIVTEAQQMFNLLQNGGRNRTTASTLMNTASSRSHAIFTIFIRQSLGDDGEMSAKFFFVDLAGSERVKKTGATGDVLKQGININLGLLELGNVISALSTIDKHKQQFISFRNSKLTRILQDCLGGNSNTYMIACISPAESNYEESLNTLKYASKAMNIKNSPVVNRDQKTMLKEKIAQLQQQNKKLRRMLAQQGIALPEVENTSGEERRLRDQNKNLSRKYAQLNDQLHSQKHRVNSMEIKMFEMRKEKDMLQLTIEELLKDNPELKDKAQLQAIMQERGKDTISLVEKYIQEVDVLEGKLKDKSNMCFQLQQEYNNLLNDCRRDEQILIKKNKLLHQTVRQNAKLRQSIAQMGKSNTLLEEPSADMITLQEQMQVQAELEQQQQSFCRMQEEVKKEMAQVDKHIVERERYLEQVTRKQITLQSQLIGQMKNQYHAKIAQLQKQRLMLLKQKDQGNNNSEKSKFVTKIDQLQNQLKDYRKRAKQQKNIEKLVDNQNSKIKDLGQELKRFKMQKGQLNKRMKQERQNYQKLKAKRIKDAMVAKKDSFKKQGVIRRLTMDNFRKGEVNKRKDEEVRRIKRVNQALKTLVRPSRRSINPQDPLQTNPQQLKVIEKDQQQFLAKSIKQILLEIDRQQSLSKYQKKLSETQHELQLLLKDDSVQELRLQRLRLKQQEQEMTTLQISQMQQLQLNVAQIKQRISLCEDSLSYCKGKHSSLLQQGAHSFDVEASVIFNKTYENMDVWRSFMRCLFETLKNLLFENYTIVTQKEQRQQEIQTLKQQVNTLKEQLMTLTAQYQRELTKMRQEMIMNRLLGNEEQDQSTLRRSDDKGDKRQLDKKVQDLSKTNRAMASDLQKLRRKCQVVQQKYQNLKNVVSKDKNIGTQQLPPFSKPQRRPQKINKQAVIQQLDGMLDNIDKLKKVKSFSTFAAPQKEEKPQVESQFGGNRWECVAKMQAHGSGVLALAVHQGYLISTASKSIKVWDLETRKLISELSGPSLLGSVKFVSIDPQRRLFYTACQKMVTIWDLTTLNVQGTLKSHKDEVRVIHGHEDYLFTAGKGSAQGGSLLVWDLRKLNMNHALQQKQKNQDIFTMTSYGDMLYYGTRNHSVRRMKVKGFDILSPFEPPHLDSVTGLTTVKGDLISGSKDKHLRLWDLNHPVNNAKHTFHVFNDYVSTIHSPGQNCPFFYAGSKDGQVKACFSRNDKIQVLAGFLTHTQVVNCMGSMADNNHGLVTGSQDKTIKLWQPSKQTSENIANLYNF